jgi:putative ABC transport system ATP-binding protein
MDAYTDQIPVMAGIAKQNTAIQLESVNKAYSTPNGEFLALKGINLTIQAGEYVGLVGKSGAGKSTLINMITGIDRVKSGKVTVDNVSVQDLDDNQRALWRGRSLGVIFQYFQMMPTMTVLDNILLPMDLCGRFQGRRSVQRAMELLEQVELEDHARKLPSALSGGQQQRVAIARALANDPSILIADEPTGRLDNATAEMIFTIFERLVDQGKTVLVATHDNALARRVSHLLVIHDGELIQDVKSGSLVL